ncbi:MAG: flagellar hook-basal body complex protein, partial [Thermoguttaceae bacterium]
MDLSSAMNTALTGLNASQTQIDVIGNNLANSNTVGFKESDVLFATQFLQTQSVGSAPTGDDAGTNPRQQGLGVEVAAITPNFSQGTISAANSPTDLAIQGDGFFIVQGQNGDQNYTRNGTFTTNAENQLVTGTGNNVLGYGVTTNSNGQVQIDRGSLVPLTIPLGSTMVAKATTKATLQGDLTTSGDVATAASIVQTGPLTDESIAQPAKTLTATTNNSGTNLNGAYSYYVTFYDSTTGTESRPQQGATTVSVTNGQVALTNLPPPVPASGTWTSERIYRNTNDQPGDTNLYEIADIPIATATAGGYTFLDNYSDASIRAGGMAPVDGSSQVPAGTNVLNFNGPPVSSDTLLSNVMEYDTATGAYDNLFPLPAATQADPNPTGTLSFAGTKGGSTLTTQNLTVTDASTLQDLATFLRGSLGIQPLVANNQSSGEAAPGVSITSDGRIQIVGNDGTPNAISVGLSAMQWTPTSSTSSTPTTSTVSLPFNQTQAAVGQGTTASMTAYDSLGEPLSVNITAVLESRTSSATTYRWYADCGQNNTGGAENIAVGTGTVSFN